MGGSRLVLFVLVLFSSSWVHADMVVPRDAVMDWEKYYVRLEGFRVPVADAARFVDRWGDRHFGTQGVSYHTDPDRVWEIIPLMLKGKDVRNQWHAFSAIKALSTPDMALTALESFSRKRWHSLRKYIIHALSFRGDARLTLPLTQMLRKEKDPAVITVLTAALGRIGGSGSSLTPLRYLALNHANLVVRSSALLSLGRIGDPSVRPVLKQALSSATKEERYMAILSLTMVPAADAYEDQKTRASIGALFNHDASQYVRLACAFHMLKRYGFNKTYAEFVRSMLERRGFFLPAIDFVEDLGYRYFLEVIRSLEARSRSPHVIARLLKARAYIREHRRK